MVLGQLDQLSCLGEHDATLRRAGYVDPATAPEVEQSFVAQDSQCAQDRVVVHVQHRREITSRRQPFSGFGLACADRPPNLGGDLVVERHRLRAITLTFSMVLLIVAPYSAATGAPRLVQRVRGEKRRSACSETGPVRRFPPLPGEGRFPLRAVSGSEPGSFANWAAPTMLFSIVAPVSGRAASLPLSARHLRLWQACLV